MSTIRDRIADLLEIWVARRQLDVASVERGLALPVGWLDQLRRGDRAVAMLDLDAWLTVLEIPAETFLAALAGLAPEEELIPEVADSPSPGLSRREIEALLRRVQDRLADLAELAVARVEAEEVEAAYVEELP